MEPESIKTKITLLIVGALIGALMTGAVNTFIQNRNRSHEKKSLKAAFAGEVTALIKIADGLEICDDLNSSISSIKTNKKPRRLYLSVKMDYFNVYKGNIAKLGLLEASLSQDICTFYTYCFSAIEYMNELSTTEWANGIDPDLALKQINRLAHLVEIVKERGRRLLKQLENEN